MRAGVLAATEKLRNLTAPQRAVLVQRLAAKQELVQGGGNSGRARTRSVAAEAAQLEMRASSYHAAPLYGYDEGDGEVGQDNGSGLGGNGKDWVSAYGRSVRQSTALDHTGSVQPQDDVEDLTLFEVDVSSMEDVLRALQVGACFVLDLEWATHALLLMVLCLLGGVCLVHCIIGAPMLG